MSTFNQLYVSRQALQAADGYFGWVGQQAVVKAGKCFMQLMVIFLTNPRIGKPFLLAFIELVSINKTSFLSAKVLSSWRLANSDSISGATPPHCACWQFVQMKSVNLSSG